MDKNLKKTGIFALLGVLFGVGPVFIEEATIGVTACPAAGIICYLAVIPMIFGMGLLIVAFIYLTAWFASSSKGSEAKK